MTQGVVRTIQFLQPGEGRPKQVRYWRARPLAERLQETLNLHREGNALFKNGNPPFSFVVRIGNVGDP